VVGQRFLIPLTAGLMLVMLVTPLSVWLEHKLRSRAAATVLTLTLVMGTLVAGAAAFGGQLIRVVERAPEMISMAAQQLADRDPATDSVLMRARDALQELDRAADRLMAAKPPTTRRRAARSLRLHRALPPTTTSPPVQTVALRETAVTGSSALIAFASNLSIIFFIAFSVLLGGRQLSERFLGLWGHQPEVHARAQSALLESARQSASMPACC
jgi:predicted PurR-regulated permease PerM